MRNTRPSVIIPTKNRSDKLARAVRSVEHGHEIVVVDDNSDADEAEKIASLVHSVPNAVLVRSDAQLGAPRARNLGVQRASGDVLAFLDSDDWWLPGRLAPHLSALEDPRFSLSYNRCRVTLPSGKAGPRMIGFPIPRGLSLQTGIIAWNFVGGTSSVCVARDAFERVGGFDPDMPSCQDWELWQRLSQVGDFNFVPVGSTVMDIGGHERITTKHHLVWNGYERMEMKAGSLDLNEKERRLVQAYHDLAKAEIAARFGDPKRSLKLLWRSVTAAPTRYSSWRALLLVGKNAKAALLHRRANP